MRTTKIYFLFSIICIGLFLVSCAQTPVISNTNNSPQDKGLSTADDLLTKATSNYKSNLLGISFSYPDVFSLSDMNYTLQLDLKTNKTVNLSREQVPKSKISISKQSLGNRSLENFTNTLVLASIRSNMTILRSENETVGSTKLIRVVYKDPYDFKQPELKEAYMVKDQYLVLNANTAFIITYRSTSLEYNEKYAKVVAKTLQAIK